MDNDATILYTAMYSVAKPEVRDKILSGTETLRYIHNRISANYLDYAYGGRPMTWLTLKVSHAGMFLRIYKWYLRNTISYMININRLCITSLLQFKRKQNVR